MAKGIGKVQVGALLSVAACAAVVYELQNRGKKCPTCDVVIAAANIFESACPSCGKSFFAFNVLQYLLA